MKPKYIIFFIFLIFFSIIIYIFCKSGNNIISQKQEMTIEKILNIRKYKATAKVTVYSNKNQNQYDIEFEENLDENYSLEKVQGNEFFSGFMVEQKDNNLKISNTNLNLSKIYAEYKPIAKNYLFLSNFINEITPEQTKEDENQIILVSKNEKNKYLHKKMLYINKNTNKIEKMEIIDKEQKIKIIIEYIKLELN